jgi:hypothetical protein
MNSFNVRLPKADNRETGAEAEEREAVCVCSMGSAVWRFGLPLRAVYLYSDMLMMIQRHDDETPSKNI